MNIATGGGSINEIGLFSAQELKGLLTDITKARVAVIGDFCLDVYWFVDSHLAESSVETGLETRPVRKQRYSLGAAGNVCANLQALGCKEVFAFGAVGDDPWGKELLRLLAVCGTDISGIQLQTQDWDTLTYVKPYIEDKESNRLDFGNFNRMTDETVDAILNKLQKNLSTIDVVIINEQVFQGIHTESFRKKLNALILANPQKTFILDSRHFSDAYPGTSLKLNSSEAAQLTGIERVPGSLILRSEVIQAGESLYKRFNRPVFITREDRGVLVFDSTGMTEIPGIQAIGRIDSVGAGDSFLSGAALALAAGRTPAVAACLGNFAAAVTVRKLFQTGTASPEEILAIGTEPSYIYRPELAEDVRQARFVPNTEFEIVTALRPTMKVTHAIFDHDGTISTLRQGWEEIMEPMMIRAILGQKYTTADESLYKRVQDRVRDYIDKSTGIQTLAQMRMLVEMTKEFGCVLSGEVLDEFGYKKIYNRALLETVNQRLAKFKRGELSLEDFTLKNAARFLKRLHANGVKLYLASGTDEADVRAEATALGYAEYFEGGIFGAADDGIQEAKKVVLDRILKEIGDNAGQGLIAVGDGPVELRETHKHGGFVIGIASDELRRFGLHLHKRSRLIRAGADMIIPDFSQINRLCEIFNLK